MWNFCFLRTDCYFVTFAELYQRTDDVIMLLKKSLLSYGVELQEIDSVSLSALKNPLHLKGKAACISGCGHTNISAEMKSASKLLSDRMNAESIMEKWKQRKENFATEITERMETPVTVSSHYCKCEQFKRFMVRKPGRILCARNTRLNLPMECCYGFFDLETETPIQTL